MPPKNHSDSSDTDLGSDSDFYQDLPPLIAPTRDQLFQFRRLQFLIHQVAVNSGWWTDIETGAKASRNFGEMIALMHSELSEALEGHRKNLSDSHLLRRASAEVELADCIIRILDTAEALGMDIAGAISEKLIYNQMCEDHTLEARRKSNGKKF